MADSPSADHHSAAPASRQPVEPPVARLQDPVGLPASGRRGCGTVGLGIALVLVGIPMLVCPGPGIATLAAGLGMIGVGLGLKKRSEQ